MYLKISRLQHVEYESISKIFDKIDLTKFYWPRVNLINREMLINQKTYYQDPESFSTFSSVWT